MPNLKKVAMNFANQVSSEQSERTKNLFAKNKFGLISSSFVEGKVAYVLMIAIGASYGIIYENTVYLKCIEIISEKLLENQRKLELSDLQCVSAVLDLTGLLLPTYNLERDLITFGNLFLENYNPNITPEVINDGNSCFFRKSKYDKNDFDLIEEKCYECIKSCLNSNEGDY